MFGNMMPGMPGANPAAGGMGMPPMFPGMPGMGSAMPTQAEVQAQIERHIRETMVRMLEEPTAEVEAAILKACKKLLRKHGFLESDAIRNKHRREESDKEEHAHDPFSANSEETEDEDRCHAWGENPMGRLFLLVDELQEPAYKGHGPQVIEKRFREACSDEVCDEELKVMGRPVPADGFGKHASALGMTEEAFKKHLASIADKIKRDDTDDEDRRLFILVIARLRA